MPPPSCTGRESPSVCRIARMTFSFLGLPAAAPLRSTTCNRRAPCAFQCLAIATGSSENTVASLIFPCLRRTQCPSLMSSAGMISIESGNSAKPRATRDGRWEDSGIPADVRDLELVSFGVDHGLGGKTTHGPREERESGHAAFVASFEEHLEPDADSQERPAAGGLEDRRTQSPRIHLAHAVGHRALARKYDAVGARHACRIGSHLDPRVRRDMLHRFGNRVEITHAVIDNRDVHCRVSLKRA